MQNGLNTEKIQTGRERFMIFKENCGQFDNMNPWEMFLYIFTHEGWLFNQVGNFLCEILSIKRNALMWHI